MMDDPLFDPVEPLVTTSDDSPTPDVYRRARLLVDLVEYGGMADASVAQLEMAVERTMVARQRDVDAGEPECVVCGCTPNAACVGRCAWVAPGLCDSCGKAWEPVSCPPVQEVTIDQIVGMDAGPDGGPS